MKMIKVLIIMSLLFSAGDLFAQNFFVGPQFGFSAPSGDYGETTGLIHTAR